MALPSSWRTSSGKERIAARAAGWKIAAVTRLMSHIWDMESRKRRRPRTTRGLLGDEGDCAVFLASGLDGDVHVLAESGEKVQEALDGKGARPIAHQGRDVRLLDAENFASIGLLEAAFFDEAVNLQREPRFQELLLGMGQTEVGKNVAAAFLHLYGPFGSRGHVSSAFLCESVRRQQDGDG